MIEQVWIWLRHLFSLTSIDEQSGDIAMGVDKGFRGKGRRKDDVEAVGAGDQGMMFGYATNETEEYADTYINGT